MEINSIIIVGGGSSGWFTASSLNKNIPEIDVTLIESPNVPTVGVGESTNLNINWFLHDSLGMRDEDWMPHCEATFKGSIKFTDFYKKGEFFHFPFGQQDLIHTFPEFIGIDAWGFKKLLYPDTPQTDFAESFWPAVQMINKNKVYLNKDNLIPNFNIDLDWAYQFDAIKLSHYMKTNLCSNTKHITDHVTKVNLDEDGGISFLSTKEHGELKADLYIDCTGFNSMLLEKSLGVPYTSYEDTLINNGTWVTKLPYVDPNIEMEMTTNGTAIDNGWVWNIPLWNRISSGYVYSDKFIDKKTALEEYKEHLKNTNQWCKDNDPNELEYRHINIRTGIHDNAWYKNCFAIGLSYGFVEPLESQGLVSVIESIRKLIIVLQTRDRHVNQFDRDCVNTEIRGELEDNKYFIIYHYIASMRDDTEYWKWYTQELKFDWENYQNCFAILAICRFKQMHLKELRNSLQCISVGNHINLCTDYTTKSLDSYMKYFNDCKKHGLDGIFDYWKERNEKISLLADRCPTHFEYLKEKIYYNA
jgi:tryptophan halogenase